MKFIELLKRADRYFDRQTPILVLFLLILALRLPNFFEPYWYGDEAIYLTLGTALREGGALYTTIIDHKTPLIYYLAMVPNQFYFRLLNLVWMLVTTALFFKFAKTLFKKTIWAWLATLVMVLLTTLPWLEGHIPNGELFVMGFVMAGAILFTKSDVWKLFFNTKKTTFVRNSRQKEICYLLSAGAFMGLGILTKVPAILDVAAFLAIFWLILAGQFFNPQTKAKELGQTFTWLLKRGLIFMTGLLLPLLASVVYFVAVGSGQDYLDYGLLYNFRYSQSWSLDLGNELLNFAFSMPGKTIILLIVVMLITLNVRKLKKRTQFICLYFLFTLYSVLLSSRPYPHYFIQMVPALALLLIDLLQNWKEVKGTALKIGLIAVTAYVMLSLGFKPYSTGEYYKKFWQFATLKITQEEYENSFDSNVKDNREVSRLIHEMGVKKIFIWGTNPLLYAQSKTVPTSRFTVAFHIKDFDDQARTFSQIEREEPKLIVVMKNERDSFPQLEAYLSKYYLPNTQFDRMVLYLRQELPEIK